MTPTEMMSRLSVDALPPERYTVEELNQLCLSSWRLKLDKGRVNKYHLTWCGDGLPEVHQRLLGNQTAIVRFNPCDLETVWVSHPDTPDDWHPARGTRPEYQNGLSLSEHQFILAQLHQDGIKSFDADASCLMLLKLSEYINACKEENSKKGLLPTKSSKIPRVKKPKISQPRPTPTLNKQLSRTTPFSRKDTKLDKESFQSYHLQVITHNNDAE